MHIALSQPRGRRRRCTPNFTFAASPSDPGSERTLVLATAHSAVDVTNTASPASRCVCLRAAFPDVISGRRTRSRLFCLLERARRERNICTTD